MKELKEEMADLRKEVREMKERWKTRAGALEKKMYGKKIKKIEGTTIDKLKEEDEERVAKITDLVTERTGNNVEIGKRQQEEEMEREETKKIKKLKRMMEDREKKERKNYLIIKGLKGKGKKNLIEIVQKFLEEEFEVKERVKDAQIAGGERREVVKIRMDRKRMDGWERKQEIMREKKSFGAEMSILITI